MKTVTRLIGLGLVLGLIACGVTPPAVSPTLTPIEPTSTPGPTSTATAPPTSTPSPTPTPIARVTTAARALFNGDYEQARAEYQAALRDSTDNTIRAAALWGLGQVEYRDGNNLSALEALRELTSEYPETHFAAYAHFLMGEIYTEMKRYREAAEAYAAYQEARPGIIDGYAHERRGDAAFAAGDFDEALAAYRNALQSPRLGDDLQLKVKMAQTYAAIGDYANAISLYDEVAASTANDYIKARVDYLAGQALIKLGESEQAYQRYLHAVEHYPLAYDSYLALLELVAADVPVDDFDRGLVDYFAGQYDVALAAFDRFLASGIEHDGTVYYYRGLTLRALGRYDEAIASWETLIASYPDNRYWTDAWAEKAYTQWAYQEYYDKAAQTLLAFAQTTPGHPETPDFLLRAGRVLERAGRLEEAARVWERLSSEYPDSPDASLALFWAGIARYRLEDYEQALTTFQRGVLLSTTPEDQARAYLWAGKVHTLLGDHEAARSAWQQAQSLDPTGYYSVRARDLLTTPEPFAPPPIYNPDVDLEAERAEAAAWVRITFELPPDTDLERLSPTLLEDPRMVRGNELWEIGLYDEARLEFESLRLAVANDPAESFRLANYLLDLGLYRPAIFAIRQVLTLAGKEDHAASLQAPPYFAHVRYGLYYADIVTPIAKEYGLHPLFLFSVIRQESLFEGFVHSTAGARGLMQIIPGTGANVARNIGWPVDFNPDDLYRPLVSVRLGAHYLATNRSSLGNDIYAALAAYNAGPGNAAIWKSLAGDDPDLLLEVIRYKETRDYIRSIYETYAIYRSLYGSGP